MSREDDVKNSPKGKQKKIAEADAKKTSKKPQEKKTKAASENLPNYGKCITCKHYPKKIAGVTQPCKIAGKYVARKCPGCQSYKCKLDA